MDNNYTIAAIVSLSLLLDGCDNITMTCSSPETVTTLDQIVQDRVTKPATDSAISYNKYIITSAQSEIDKLDKACQSRPEIIHNGICNLSVGQDGPSITHETYESNISEANVLLATITANPLKFEVGNIITTSQTDRLVSCKAIVHVSGGDGWVTSGYYEHWFEYTVEKTDDGRYILVNTYLDH